jgi:hypothetical protein
MIGVVLASKPDAIPLAPMIKRRRDRKGVFSWFMGRIFFTIWDEINVRSSDRLLRTGGWPKRLGAMV